MNRFLFLVFFLGMYWFAQAQTDTVFYNADKDKVATLRLATTYEIISRSASAPNEELVKKYTKAGQLIAEDHYYITPTQKELIGTSHAWYESGKLKREIVYTDDKINGSCKTYWENGQLKRNDVYENGKFILGRCYTAKGADTLHYDLETMPEFKGGVMELRKYIQTTLQYPENARKKNIEGKVLVKFIVEKDGSITNVAIQTGVNDELDKEAMRVIQNMPKWAPGNNYDDPARVHFVVPIVFKLH